MQDGNNSAHSPSPRRTPVIVLFERSLIEASDRVAGERFEGNRSLLIRTAVRELIDRVGRQQPETEEAA